MTESEAWVRKKAKRIIHNQTLIQILMIITVAIPIPASGLVLWLIFSFYPSVVIPCLIVAWIIGSTMYVVLRIWSIKQRKKT